MHACMHTDRHTDIHYITLHYITVQYITLQYSTVHTQYRIYIYIYIYICMYVYIYICIYINCKHMSTYLNHFKSYVSSVVLFHVNSQWVESNTQAFCFHRSQLGAFTALRSPAGGAERDALLRPSQRSGANEGGKVPWRDLLDMAGVGKQRFTHGSRITRTERGKSSNVWAVGNSQSVWRGGQDDFREVVSSITTPPNHQKSMCSDSAAN